LPPFTVFETPGYTFLDVEGTDRKQNANTDESEPTQNMKHIRPAVHLDIEKGSNDANDLSEISGNGDMISSPIRASTKGDQSSDIVTWDCDNDPENPMNWSTGQKWLTIALISILTLVTYARLVSSKAKVA
jgi:hypothetical protein